MKQKALDDKTSEIKAHAKYSASGSERWRNCPGSIALCEKAPPARESFYAAEGTEAHACLEFLLKNRHKLSFAIKVAEKKYNAEMIEHAVDAVNYILQRAKAFKNPDILCETRVDASYFTCPDQFGTLDAAIADRGNRLIVIDYKFGAGVAVDPEGYDGLGNSQLIYYALGVSKLFDHDFKEVELIVIQPRAFHPSGESIRSHVLPMKSLRLWIEVFKKAVKETERDDAPVVSGPWCKFCNAATICPQLKDDAFKAAKIVFSEAEPIEKLKMPEPALMQLPHLGRVLEACDRLEAWIGKVRDHGYHVLENGGKIEGWKLVAKNSPRRWKDKAQAEFDADMAFGHRAFSPPKFLSPAQLEKAIGKKNAEKFISKNTTNESSGTTMVRADDKRPAWKKQSAKDVFQEWDDGSDLI